MERHSEGSAVDAWPADAVEVARILDAWGVKGWIKLQPFASDPQALFASPRWYLKPAAHAVTPSSLPPLLHVTEVKAHSDVVVACARELGDREAARALRGAPRTRARRAAHAQLRDHPTRAHTPRPRHCAL